MDKITTAQQKRYTLAEFEEIEARPENQDRLLELFHGEIIEKVPTPDHSVLAAVMATFLSNYVMEHGDHDLVSVEGRHQVEGDSSLLPDVSLIKNRETSPAGKRFSRMPDLAVEIKSPDDDDTKLREKAAYYLENGAQQVWLIYPEKLIIEICQPNTATQPTGLPSGQTLTINDTLEGGDLLPGFSVPLQRIFKKIMR